MFQHKIEGVFWDLVISFLLSESRLIGEMSPLRDDLLDSMVGLRVARR